MLQQLANVCARLTRMRVVNLKKSFCKYFHLLTSTLTDSSFEVEGFTFSARHIRLCLLTFAGETPDTNVLVHCCRYAKVSLSNGNLFHLLCTDVRLQQIAQSEYPQHTESVFKIT